MAFEVETNDPNVACHAREEVQFEGARLACPGTYQTKSGPNCRTVAMHFDIPHIE
jgi:hypothetical protein